jgi:hypothetical protein
MITQQVNTVKHIPRTARTRFVICLEKVFKEAVYQPSSDSWLRLLLFAKCVLWKPRRAGKRFDLGKCILSRLEEWENSGWESLWRRASASHPESKEYINDAKAKAQKAGALASQGRYGMACRALISEGFAPRSGGDTVCAEANPPLSFHSVAFSSQAPFLS